MGKMNMAGATCTYEHTGVICNKCGWTNPKPPSISKWLDDWLWKYDRNDIYDGPIIPEIKRLMVKAMEARERDTLTQLLDLQKSSDEERLIQTYDAREEAEKWKAEGDMYGWNFHQGRSAGTIWASIIFDRVRRTIEKLITNAT